MDEPTLSRSRKTTKVLETMSRTIGTYLIVALLIFSVGSIALPRSLEEHELIAIKMEVTDKAGRQVADLERRDVTIYENGVKQTLFSFERAESVVNGTKHTSYVLTYVFNGRHDGTRRRVRVAVHTNSTQLIIRTLPKSYIAPKRQSLILKNNTTPAASTS